MNILIIEDIKETCNFIAAVISNNYSDMCIDCAYSFDDGLKKIKKNSYDILIIDYELDKNNAEKNGIELGRQLSLIGKYKDTPILFETSYPDYVLQAVNSLNCLYYLVKPFKEDDIVKMIKKVLSRNPNELKLTFRNSNGIKILLNCSDIIYANVTLHQLNIVTHNDIFAFNNYSLSQLSNDSNGLLLQCHKSYLINPMYIKFIDNVNKYITLEWLSGKATIPIGRKYAEKINFY